MQKGKKQLDTRTMVTLTTSSMYVLATSNISLRFKKRPGSVRKNSM